MTAHTTTNGEASTTKPETAVAIGIVDYGLGNIRSVTRGLERGGATVTLVDDPDRFSSFDGIVLPGVGAFREGVENAGPYRDALVEIASTGTPVFGICLGMQMLLSSSEEAEHAGEGDAIGLSVIPGRNVRFRGDQKVPHMGWNQLRIRRDHPVFRGIDGGYAYFVHSYYAEPDDQNAIVATSDYGVDFPAIIANERGNVFGTQFHPEKSGDVGLTILRNFTAYCANAPVSDDSS